jgi:HlyD family secretion protein
MYATATIPLARVSGALAVPREALTTRNGHRAVLRIDGNIVSDVPVTEGISDTTHVQISDGLKAGDIVVADARRDVAPGTKVNPVLSR